MSASAIKRFGNTAVPYTVSWTGEERQFDVRILNLRYRRVSAAVAL